MARGETKTRAQWLGSHAQNVYYGTGGSVLNAAEQWSKLLVHRAGEQRSSVTLVSHFSAGGGGV